MVNVTRPSVPTRDHKRAFDGDEGPNTGGMGAYSSDDLLSPAMRDAILRHVVEPTIRGLAADGVRYQGFLYFGLMLTASGPKVLEFNCRLGDPEAQAIVARMDFDLAEVLLTPPPADSIHRSCAGSPEPVSASCWRRAVIRARFEIGKMITGLTDIDWQ